MAAFVVFVCYAALFQPFDINELNFLESLKGVDDRFFEKMFLTHSNFSGNVKYEYEYGSGFRLEAIKPIQKGELLAKFDGEAIFDHNVILSRNVAQVGGGSDITPEIFKALESYSYDLPMTTVLLGHMATPAQS